MTVIPIHHLQDDAKLNLNMAHFQVGHVYPENPADVHRDDHYLFFLFEQGAATLRIDFQEVSFGERCAFYILPGQVHHRLHNQQAQGWYLAVDTQLIPPEFRTIFEGNLGLQPPLYLAESLLRQCTTILQLISDRRANEDPLPFQSNVTLSLFHSFAGIIAGGYRSLNEETVGASRPKQLTYAFRKLVLQQFRSRKSPSEYAHSLHVSVNYLNEVVKKTTGFAASYWISQQLLLEAKRLLIYTQMDVQEVANSLGYPDAAYFSKWFKKHERISPRSFRARNVE